MAIQADQIEQARWELEVALAVLAGGIAVTIVLAAQWEASVGTPAEKSYEMALIGFGTVLALGVIAQAIAVLISLDDAGKRTSAALADVIDTYQWVVDDVAATMPTGLASGGWLPTVLASSAARSSEMVSGPSNASDSSGVVGGWQDWRGAVTGVAGPLLGDSLSDSHAGDMSVSGLPTLGEFAGWCRHAAMLSSNDSPGRSVSSRPVARLQWLAALAPPVVPAVWAEARAAGGVANGAGPGQGAVFAGVSVGDRKRAFSGERESAGSGGGCRSLLGAAISTS